MWRFFAGAAATFLLMTGAFLLWQGRAERRALLPSAPSGRAADTSLFAASASLEAPSASEKTREEKRFSRADKNKDGKIEFDEYLAGRRRYFDKLDVDHDGKLTFEEYAAKGIQKFQTADVDHNGWLSPEEFATTAAPQSKRRSGGCSCGKPAPVQEPAENTASNDDGQ